MVNNFSQISDALKYIDEHLDETMSLEVLAGFYEVKRGKTAE